MNRVVLLAIFVAASMSCPAAVIFTENFEGATPGYYSTVGAISGSSFSLFSGSIDIKGPGWYPLLCTGAAAGNCVDTIGGSAGTSGQKIETTSSYSDPAGIYRLTFDIGAWTAGDGTPLYTNATGYSASVLARLGGWSESFTRSYGASPATITRTFASSGGKLSFETTASTLSWAGLVLDNVTLEAIPEPSSIVLLGSGMIALLAAARRRRRV